MQKRLLSSVENLFGGRIRQQDTGGGEDEEGVAGMDLGDMSLTGEDAPGGQPGTDQPRVDEPGVDEPGAGPAERNMGPPESMPGRGGGRTGGGRTGGRRTGGRPEMTGDQPGSARSAAASELEDPEGLYVLRNAVNLARDLARTMCDRPA